jgi:hypothetical protein
MPASFPTLDFKDFHQVELPGRIAAGHGSAAAAGALQLPSLGLRIRETGAACTYAPRAGSIEVLEGDEGADTLVALAREAWEGLVHDLETPASLLYHGEVERVRGDMMDFVQWEAALRALYTGRPVYDPERVDLRDRRGQPLDPATAFGPDDDLEEMAHFLREVGYLFVKGLFSHDEVERFRVAAAQLHERARPGDGKSWWGRNHRAEEVLCRALQAGVMPALAGLPTDPRILRLVELADTPMLPKIAGDLDGVTVLWKNPAMKEGLSDLPWHRDCGMGGHASMCPTLVGSIFLTENTPEAGALRFLPGSWKTTYRFAEASDASALAGVRIPAEPGDFTLHYGDGWHTAPPPTSDTGPFRSCVLVSFERQGAFNHRGERHYNDVLLGDEAGQVAQMTQVAARY